MNIILEYDDKPGLMPREHVVIQSDLTFVTAIQTGLTFVPVMQTDLTFG